MASQGEVKLLKEILAVAIKVNSQPYYNVWVDFSGHVNGFEVRVSEKYEKGGKDVKGWNTGDRNVYLSTGYELGYRESIEDVITYKIEKLSEVKADLSKLLAKGKAKR